MTQAAITPTTAHPSPTSRTSTLFRKETPQQAYLKAGIYGEPGSGKTFTASLMAQGLALHIAGKGKPLPPVMMLDSEGGAPWVRSLFQSAGIEFLVSSTRSFQDLKQAVLEAEAAGAILIVDSMTHYWEEIREAYLAAKRKRLNNSHARLELPDWNVIKPEWAKFTALFLNSKAHIILCGRGASIYEFQLNEETNKKELITAGTRMAAEKGMGYEPSLLIEMTSRQCTGPKKTKSIVRTATVLKDRSDVLDGLQFDDPTFESFLPHIERLNLGGAHSSFDDSRSSEQLFPSDPAGRDNQAIRRKIMLGDIHDLLTLHIPGQGAADRQRKVQLLRKCFNAGWAEMEEVMPLDQLRKGLGALRGEFEGEGAGEEQGAALTVGQLQDTAADLIEREMAAARTAAAVERVWKTATGVFNSVDDVTQARMLAARQQALARVAGSKHKAPVALE